MPRSPLTRAAVAAAVVVATVAVVLAVRGAGDGEGEPAGEPADTRPRILDVRYEPDARPPGATRSYPALVVDARDPDGQVVAVTVTVDGRASVADGRCGIATDTWTLPMRLAPGRHDVRVEVESSTCRGGREPLERAVEETTIRVPRR